MAARGAQRIATPPLLQRWVLERQELLNDTADPIEDYLAALRLLEGAGGDVDLLVPGHGSVGGADQIHARIEQDRAYLHALRDAQLVSDPRVGPSATYDWLPGVHERQLQNLARRRRGDGRPTPRPEQ